MTEQEERVVNLVADGLDAIEIASELGISPWTVKARKRRVARGMGYTGKRVDVFLVRAVFGVVPSQSRLEKFEPKLRRTAELAVQAMTNAEIAEAIGISPESIRNYMQEIFDAAGVWNRRELARFLLSQAEAAIGNG